VSRPRIVGQLRLPAERYATVVHPTVSRDAYIGAGAIVGQGLAVGELALVGMGAVVTKDIPAREVWAGVPARRMRDVVIPGEPLTHSAEPDGSGLLTCQPSGYQLWMTAPQP
jgi:acetyltransferase-like isoleucine patch superfamily enzyme